ncbi:MAG: BMP family ABC transporter substrate-binding protein [Anaerolineales bacterium]|nr:BMP family ABC transporter substrate-binding protein [Anaerolineales bacterium]
MSKSAYRFKYLCPVILIAVLLLSACAKAEPPAPTEAQESSASTTEPLIVAFAHVGPVSDEGWTYSHDQGRIAVEEAFPNVETITIESMPFSEDATRALEGLVAAGAKIVFVTSGYADYIYEAAKAHPEVAFFECGAPGPDLANLVGYAIDAHNVTYLLGVAAGLMTESNKLGYIGAYPGAYGDVNAFELGALSVNPDATTAVVFINSWFDPAAVDQAANALIDDGADFLYGITADPTYLSVAEELGVWAATWNTDMRRFGPNAYVSSVLLNWNDFYVNEVQAFIDGTWTGNRYVSLPLGGGVDRDAWGQNVPENVQTQVDAVREEILGGWSPFVGPIKDSSGTLRVEVGVPMEWADIVLAWDWPMEGIRVKE